MLKEELENLLFIDNKPFESNGISKELLSAYDEFILSNDNSDKCISSEVFNIYKKFVSMKQEAPAGMKNELFEVMKNYVREKVSGKEYLDALFMLRFLMMKSKLQAGSYYEIAEILSKMNDNTLAMEFIDLYDKFETNKPLKLLSLGNFYNLQLKDYRHAIKFYEQYLKIDETKSVIYTILAGLYAKEYGEFSLKDQVYYFEKAYRLKPEDRLILHGLAFGYEKLGDINNARKFYQKLLENNPTNTDYYNYGAFLISCGELQEGHKFLTHRFNIDDKNLQYPVSTSKGVKWDLKSDISDKTLLVHYEQGFGDTFMYCRFVPGLKPLAKKVIFVVQNELFELIKSSEIFEGIDIVSSKLNLDELEFDVHMSLLDAPFVCGVDSCNLPYTDKYLNVDEILVQEYAKKYLVSSGCLKVGISYQGNKSANYNGRDIDFSRFSRLFNLKNIDFYSFSLDAESDERVISLGKTFENFTYTACALKNMDIVISSDNVILNLAGALGVKTYGLFNKNPNFRWFKLTGDNIGWYESVTPLQAEENNYWSDVFSELVEILNKNSKNNF